MEPLRFADYEAAIRWCEDERANVVASTQAAFEHGHLVHAHLLPSAMWGYFSLRMNLAEWGGVTDIALRAARMMGDEYAEAICLYVLGGQQGASAF